MGDTVELFLLFCLNAYVRLDSYASFVSTIRNITSGPQNTGFVSRKYKELSHVLCIIVCAFILFSFLFACR